MTEMHVCRSSDLHPYECDGPPDCPHCAGAVTDDHDPATCALCEPVKDWQNPEAE